MIIAVSPCKFSFEGRIYYLLKVDRREGVKSTAAKVGGPGQLELIPNPNCTGFWRVVVPTHQTERMCTGPPKLGRMVLRKIINNHQAPILLM